MKVKVPIKEFGKSFRFAISSYLFEHYGVYIDDESFDVHNYDIDEDTLDLVFELEIKESAKKEKEFRVTGHLQENEVPGQ